MGNLLINTGEYANGAFIDSDEKAIAYHQLEGYYRAVKILIEKSEVRKDSLIFPIMYCVRHFIEILLKYNIDYINEHSYLTGKYSKTHDVLDNLKILDNYIGELMPENPLPNGIKKYITDIISLDKDSNSTRFKYNIIWNKKVRKDEVSFKDAIEIDLDILNDAVDEIYALSCIPDMLQEKWSILSEMQSI
jgi:hypothetical protein